MEEPGMAGGAGEKQDNDVDAATRRTARMVKRYDIGENEAAIAMHRVDHDLGPPDARDDDRWLPFADDREIGLEARIAVVSQEVHGNRGRSFSGSAGGIELADRKSTRMNSRH